MSESQYFAKEELAEEVSGQHFKPLSPLERSDVMNSDLNCDVIESDCLDISAEMNEKLLDNRNGTAETEVEKQATMFNLQVIENNSNNALQRRSGSFRSTTGNFFKAFIAARVKAKSCSPTPTSVTMITNDAPPPTSGCIST